MRAFDRDLIRAGHYGQRLGCRANRPNTWLHRPAYKREENPCQLGAVHTWRWSQRVDATLYPERERWSVRQCVEVIFEALRHQIREDRALGSLAAWRVAERDWASVWSA